MVDKNQNNYQKIYSTSKEKSTENEILNNLSRRYFLKKGGLALVVLP